MTQRHVARRHRRVAIDRGDRHRRVVDDAVDDHLGHVLLHRHLVGGEQRRSSRQAGPRASGCPSRDAPSRRAGSCVSSDWSAGVGIRSFVGSACAPASALDCTRGVRTTLIYSEQEADDAPMIPPAIAADRPALRATRSSRRAVRRAPEVTEDAGRAPAPRYASARQAGCRRLPGVDVPPIGCRWDDPGGGDRWCLRGLRRRLDRAGTQHSRNAGCQPLRPGLRHLRRRPSFVAAVSPRG